MNKITKPMSCAAAIAVSMAVVLASPSMAYADDATEDTTVINTEDTTPTTTSDESDDQSDVSDPEQTAPPVNDKASNTPQQAAFQPLNAPVPAPDTTKPVVELTSEPSILNPGLASFVIQASDNEALVSIVGNVYQGGALKKSTQSPASGVSGEHTVNLSGLADGTYTLRYNAKDAAGNIASTKEFTFTIDTVAPTVTIKDGAVFSNNRTRVLSFKLYDAGKVDRVVLNGVEKDLSNNVWSDLNTVKPGQFGAVEGLNTLVVYDVAGNATTVQFTLDTTGPTATVKPESVGQNDLYQNISFKLNDGAMVDRLWLNGVEKDLSNNVWSDLNGVKPGTFGGAEGINTLVLQDALGNQSTVTFVIDTTKPVLTLPSGVVIGANPYTFQVSQVEANPDRTYVEIQQLVDGKWKKFAGEWFYATNSFDFTVDADALGLQHGVQTQLKVSTWDKAGFQTSSTSAVTVDLVGPKITWQLQPEATYGIGDGFHVRPITNEVGTLKAVYIDSVAPENLVWSLDSDHKNFDTKNTSNQALWDSLSDGEHTFIAVFTDPVGNSTTSSSNTFVVDRTAPVVTNEAQEWQEKDGGRASVTLTFSEPVSGLPQGWYGSGMTWTKAFYNTKPSTVTFTDAAGNPGSYVVTPMAAPVEENEPQTPVQPNPGGDDNDGNGGDNTNAGNPDQGTPESVPNTPLTPATQLAHTGDGSGLFGALAAVIAMILGGIIGRLKHLFG